MAVTKVQSKGATGSSNAWSISGLTAPVQGNLLVVVISTSSTFNPQAVTNAGYTNLNSGTTSPSATLFWKIAGVSESTTVSGTYGSSSGGCVASFIEYNLGGTIGTPTAATIKNASGSTTITSNASSPGTGLHGVFVAMSCTHSSAAGPWTTETIGGLTASNIEDTQQNASFAIGQVVFDLIVASTSGSYTSSVVSNASTAATAILCWFPVSGTANTQSLTASLIPAGAEPIQQTNKSLTASLIASGSLLKNIFHMLVAALIMAGALTKATIKTAFAAAVNSSAALTVSRLYARTLTASTALAGSITRQTGKALSAALIGAGALTRAVSHKMTAALSGAGTVVKTTSHALSGALSATGVLTRSTGKILTAALPSAGVLAKKTAHGLSGALSAAGDLATSFSGGVHNFTQSLTASLALSGALPKRLGTTISAALIPAGAVFKRTNKNLAGTPPIYALVGTAGAENTTGVTGGDLNNLAWGTGENRTANNLLILAVQSFGTATLPAAPSGWLTASQIAGTSCSVSIFYKVATGGDGVPTVTGVTGGVLFGNLTEFSGNSTSPLDQTNTSSSTASPVVVTMPGTNATSGELALWTNTSAYSPATAINPITVACNNGSTHGLAQNPGTTGTSHYATFYTITTSNNSADSWTYTPNTITNITGEATAIVSFKLGSGLISLGLSGSTSRLYGKVFTAALAFVGAITRGISHGVTAALAAAGNLTKFGARSLSGSLGLAGNVTKSTIKKAFAAAVNFVGSISTTIFRLSGVTFNAALGLVGNTTKFSARTVTAALALAGSVARAFPVAFSAALGMAGSVTKFIPKAFQASLPLAGAMGKTLYELFTAALSFAGGVATIVGHVTLKLLTATLGLGSRGSYDATILGDGPVLYVTQLDVDSAGAHTVTHTGTPTTRAMPNGDDAMQFNGTNQYVSVADADDLSVNTTNALTLEAWVTPSVLNMPTSITPTGYVNLIGKASWWSPPAANQYEYELRYFNQNTTESPAANPPEAFSGYAYNTLNGGIGFGHDDFKGVTIGTWAHLVIVIDSTASPSRISIYRDGKLANSTTFTGTPQNGTAPFTIGSCETGELTHSYWNGGIGKVAVYPRVLTATEIQEHYNVMALGAPPVPVLFTQFGKVFNGALSMAGSIKRSVVTTIQAALAFTVDSSRKTNRKIAAALSLAGSVLASRVGSITKNLTASLGLAGSVLQGHVFGKVLTASLAMTGKLTKSAGKLLVAAVVGVGVITRKMGKKLVAGVGFIGITFAKYIAKFTGPAMDLPTFLVIKAHNAFAKLRSANVKVRVKDDPSNADVKPDDTDLWTD